MANDPVEEYINSLPPPSVNNSRTYARRVYNKAKKEMFGGYYSRVFEEISGIPSDRTPYDCGIEMERKHKDK